MSKLIDLTGKRFRKLVVIRRVENRNNHTMWMCKCDCGKTVTTYSSLLLNGRSKSCGCYKTDNLVKYNKKYNQYDLSNCYGIGITSNTNKEFYFDLEDYDKIKDICWHENKYGYLVGSKSNEKFLFHRLILNCEPSKVVDHINHNTLDNRKSNIRVCSCSQNMMNKDTVSNNSSGQNGVSFNKNLNKWETYLNINHKRIRLGYYENLSDAIYARVNAEKQYFKEFKYNN